MFDMCKGCKAPCEEDVLPLVLESEQFRLAERFTVVPERGFRGLAGYIPQDASGHCPAFSNGLCLEHHDRRPIVCITFPFFPYKGSILISRKCPFILAEVQKMDIDQRARLREQILDWWSEDRIDDILRLGEYTKDWPEVHVL